MRTGLIVLGMHRSGTSMLTRILNLLGAYLPKDLEPAQPDNPAGFWEPRLIVDFNYRLLNSQGLAWNSLKGLSPEAYNALSRGSAGAEASALLLANMGNEPLFALKDPRMCRLMPFWLPVISAQDIEPRFITIIRHPLEVAKSLEKRNSMDIAAGLLLWLVHVLEAERDSRGYLRTFVCYDDLLADWRPIADRLGVALRLQWPRAPNAAAADIQAFVSADARHHVALPAAGASLLHTWAQGLYDRARVASLEGDSQGWRDHCDEMRRQLPLLLDTCELLQAGTRTAAEKTQRLAYILSVACNQVVAGLRQ